MIEVNLIAYAKVVQCMLIYKLRLIWSQSAHSTQRCQSIWMQCHQCFFIKALINTQKNTDGTSHAWPWRWESWYQTVVVSVCKGLNLTLHSLFYQMKKTFYEILFDEFSKKTALDLHCSRRYLARIQRNRSKSSMYIQ